MYCRVIENIEKAARNGDSGVENSLSRQLAMRAVENMTFVIGDADDRDVASGRPEPIAQLVASNSPSVQRHKSIIAYALNRTVWRAQATSQPTKCRVTHD